MQEIVDDSRTDLHFAAGMVRTWPRKSSGPGMTRIPCGKWDTKPPGNESKYSTEKK